MTQLRTGQKGVHIHSEEAAQARQGRVRQRAPWRLALLATFMGLAGLLRLGEGLGQALAAQLDGPELVVLKASRGVALERIIPLLTPRAHGS